jgi:hypothetical protein
VASTETATLEAEAPRRIHVYVSGLRKILGDERLVTQRPGYLLRVGVGETRPRPLKRFTSGPDSGRYVVQVDDPDLIELVRLSLFETGLEAIDWPVRGGARVQ